MRRFSSYGPVNTKLHYYAPREELIKHAITQLIGESPDEGGHYFTTWGSRQTGKTWTLQQVLFRLRKDKRFDIVKINIETMKMTTLLFFLKLRNTRNTRNYQLRILVVSFFTTKYTK